MSDLDAPCGRCSPVLACRELSPWQERVLDAFLDDGYRQVVVTTPQQSGHRAWAETLEHAWRNAKAPATMGDGGSGTAG